MTSCVLIIKDEKEMQVILLDNLEHEGCKVLAAETGEQGVDLALNERPDILLLDVMLPNMSGYEVCKRVRSAGLLVPIIMITARNAEIDRVTGLDFGADDYVGKPFSLRELVARIRARLRRFGQAERSPDLFTFGDVVVDMVRREVFRDSRRLNISSREFDLLFYLVSHRGEVVSRQRLLTEVWGYNYLAMTRTVDDFVAKLRGKIEPDHAEPRHIVTVHGSGYRFVA